LFAINVVITWLYLTAVITVECTVYSITLCCCDQTRCCHHIRRSTTSYFLFRSSRDLEKFVTANKEILISPLKSGFYFTKPLNTC